MTFSAYPYYNFMFGYDNAPVYGSETTCDSQDPRKVTSDPSIIPVHQSAPLASMAHSPQHDC